MSIFFDNSKVVDNINVIFSAHHITDLSFDTASKTVSVRKVSTIPFFGSYISWLIFKFSSQATIDKTTQGLVAFYNERLSNYQAQLVKDVDGLFQQCKLSFSEDISNFKSFQGSRRVLHIAVSKYVTVPEIANTDELKDRIKTEFSVLKALDKGKVTSEMNISIKTLFNLGQILADAMSVESKPGLRDYIDDADIPDRKISSMVPVYKKYALGPYKTLNLYPFEENEMSFYKYREHLKEEIKNTIMVSIRKAQDVPTKLKEWREKTPALIDDKIEKFFKLNGKLVRSLTPSQKESLEQEMTQIYTELFPEVIDSIASSLKID